VWAGQYYDYFARRSALGLGYSDDLVVAGQTVWQPWSHYPVGYSGFLGGLYAVFGAGQYVGPVANAVLGAFVVMLTHRVALHWLTPVRALVAGVLCGLNLELVFYSPVLMTEVLGTVLPLLSLWVGLVWGRRWLGKVGAGVVMGFATLVQPQMIVIAPLVGGVVDAGPVWSWRRVAGVALVTVAAFVTVMPWTIRNCRVMDGCAFVSTNGGWNFAIGSFPRATGRYEMLKASDGCTEVTGQVDQDRCWGKLGVGWVREDVWRWVRLAPVKLAYCFDHSSFPVQYLGQADPDAWPESQRRILRGVLTGMHRVLLTVAMFGVVSCPWAGWGERSRLVRGMVCEWVVFLLMLLVVGYSWLWGIDWYWPLAAGIVVFGLWVRRTGPELGVVGVWVVGVIGLFMVTHVVFFGEDRYHVRLIPLLCMLACGVGRVGSGGGIVGGSGGDGS